MCNWIDAGLVSFWRVVAVAAMETDVVEAEPVVMTMAEIIVGCVGQGRK